MEFRFQESCKTFMSYLRLHVYLHLCTRSRPTVPIAAVGMEKLAVRCDQDSYHSCFPDLISRAWAKLPLGSQFSFFLIGILIISEKHIVFAYFKVDSARVLFVSVTVLVNIKPNRKIIVPLRERVV